VAALPRPVVRRTITVGALLLATVLALPASLVAVPLLGLIDLVLPGPAWRTRTWCLVVGALVYEVAGVGAAVLTTLWHLGRNDRPTAQTRFHRLEHWWADLHARNFRRFAGVRWVVENPEVIDHGPAVVLARHANHVDALLPVLLFGLGGGLELRYTLKDSLQWAPAMDIVGNRLPNVFVDREPGPGSPMVAELEALASTVDRNSVAVIFPEGTFYTPERLDRIARRIAETRPELEATVRGLRHLLPPRPTGTAALLRGAPDADLLIVAHEGMQGFGGGALTEIARNLPLDDPVRVRLWRIPRTEVPTDDATFVAWLLDVWVDVDDWIERSRRERAEAGGSPPSLADVAEFTW
jgi:1-acyl-sn-glycerol-3-phosphate acyltransferase